MISEKYFRLRKDGAPLSFCYCTRPELIENYDKAIADKTQIWECHHRLEQVFSKEQLIAGGNYYNVEPECLIFLTKEEHRTLHHKGKQHVLGYHHTEEAKRKIGKASKERIRKPKRP